mmetsp:Transcript_18343/g.31391  ORF Transcript_18343/g.31391 Transcript_18343/m.31391 type:complete len:321 (+) Transcript_18343:849-1811(+)
MESMIIFTHSSCSTFSGSVPPTTEPMKAVTRATKLTVSWNWRNFRMLVNTERPHSTDFTMEEKLSSMIMMSAASFATSVPAMPMARPTSEALSAAASFVPSPVTATTSPRERSALTSVRLSSGEDRANTRMLGSIASMSASLRARKAGPSMAVYSDRFSGRMPHSRAMWRAVWMLSPVTMRTTMPASWHVITAWGTSLRTGSLMPTIARSVRVASQLSASSKKSSGLLGSSRGRSHVARAMHRSPSLAIASTCSSNSCLRCSSLRGVMEPSWVYCERHLASTHSAAPLLCTTYLDSSLITQQLILRSLLNPKSLNSAGLY